MRTVPALDGPCGAGLLLPKGTLNRRGSFAFGGGDTSSWACPRRSERKLGAYYTRPREL